ncbi:MAG: TonB-dependent receptor plug domain-containing protein [Gammaproteobacteria bacterium]|nr:TonB-dependent receptor plug domain-containing protein [Gammaproteobacteria bacterium]
MNPSSKLNLAIAAILGSGAMGLAHAAAAPSNDSNDQLQTITVTAQRRAQNMQDVPITIQAFTAKTLSQLHIETFDDYVKYLPNVTAPTNGPGQGNIFMRGLSVGAAGSQSSGTIGGFPNVAIYLDDQSGQLPARNLDVYAADLQRIEILEGPQGTLFGAGAEAGVVRYITNKPVLDKTEGNVSAGYGVTAHGDPNTNLTAVLNLPLIDGKSAMRVVVYNDSRGGYIDNVPGTFTRQNSDLGIGYANYPAVNGQCPNGKPPGNYYGSPVCVPPNAPAINNYNIAKRAINPVTYKGIRGEFLYKFNEDWNLLVTQMYQNMDAEGVFYQMPYSSDGVKLQPLQVTLFNNAYNKDKFENTAWTVNGKFGQLNAVYTGAYLVRHVEQVGDYTNYARGVYADYYQCYGPGGGPYSGHPDANLTSTCYSPSSIWQETERNEHLSQEFRLSTPTHWRMRAIGGVYWEDNKLFDQTDWGYKTIPACTSNTAPGTPGNSGCLSNVGTAPGASAENPGAQPDNIAFFEDTRRDVRQLAEYLSVDYDIIPHTLTVTLGTRHFRFDNSFKGSVTGSFGCFEQGAPAGGCVASANNLDARNLQDTESGWRSRANLTWHVNSDVMVYYTFSQGFRPGGFNRTGGNMYIYGPDGVKQFVLPSTYSSDSLNNNEVGWKTQWWHNRVQWNGAIYQENWNNVQVGFFDPGQTGNLTFGTNGQNFRVRGLETSIIARVTDHLTVQGAASWNRSEQTNSPALTDGNPASANYGKPITESCNSSGLNCTPISNLYGPIGSPSANSPPIQFSLRARYDWMLNDYRWFVQAGATHTGHSFTQAGANPSIATGGAINTTVLRFENPAYSSYDASFGVAKGAWNAQVYCQNCSDSNASVFTNSGQFVIAQTIVRPRVIGVSFGYDF